MGIEPTYSAWKAEVLPLNYTRADSISNHRAACNTLYNSYGVKPACYRPPKNLLGGLL